MIAFIPARCGSTRVKGKNVRPLVGHPLIAYSIRAAVDSGIFSAVYLATDSEEYAEIGTRYGATWWRRKPSAANEPDFEWCKGIVETGSEYFTILRPTSPFRTAATIQRAWAWFDKTADSMRAVSPAKTNPYKMWLVSGSRMQPIMDDCTRDWEQSWAKGKRPKHPKHSVASQTLPPAWAQNASLEIAHTYVLEKYGNISGHEIQPFFSRGHEGVNIDTEDDFDYATWLAESGRAALPEV